jgi:hypothetical protein
MAQSGSFSRVGSRSTRLSASTTISHLVASFDPSTVTGVSR